MNANTSRDIIPFAYVVSPITLVASASGTQTLTLATDSQFELHRFMASTSLDSKTDFMPNFFSVQITDQSTGRLLMSARVPQRVLCGPSNHSIYQARPVQFPPNANLLFDFLNLDSGNTNVITMVLLGYKIFRGIA